MKNHPKNMLVMVKGPPAWNFKFERGELAVQTFLEEDADGRKSFTAPMVEDMEEVERVMLEKIGSDACAEGTYSIDPGRPSRIKYRIVSPTH